MKSILLILFVSISYQLFSQSDGIHFQKDSTLEQMLAKSQETGKLIFIDCYTVWCGPCKWLDKNVFPQKEVGDFYNQHFINYKMDMETPEGEIIKAKYGVTAYPTLLFLNSQGEKVHQGCGSMPADFLIELGEWAMDTTSNYMAVKKKIENNVRDLQTLITYLDVNVNAANKDTILNECFELLSHDEKYTDAYWHLFSNHVNDIESPLFQYLIENRKEYEEKRGVNDVRDKLERTFERTLLYSRYDSIKLKSLEEIDDCLFHDIKSKLHLKKAFRSADNNKSDQKKWELFIEALDVHLAHYELDMVFINNYCWYIYENYKLFNDIQALTLAKKWSYKAYLKFPEDPYFNGTYAHIIYELGNKTEGIKHLEIALKYSKEKEPNLVSYYQEELEKFKSE